MEVWRGYQWHGAGQWALWRCGEGQALARTKVHSKCRLAGFGLWLQSNPQRNLGRDLPKTYVFSVSSRVLGSPTKAWILQEKCPTEISQRFEWSLTKDTAPLIRAGHWATKLPEVVNTLLLLELPCEYMKTDVLCNCKFKEFFFQPPLKAGTLSPPGNFNILQWPGPLLHLGHFPPVTNDFIFPHP